MWRVTITHQTFVVLDGRFYNLITVPADGNFGDAYAQIVRVRGDFPINRNTGLNDRINKDRGQRHAVRGE